MIFSAIKAATLWTLLVLLVGCVPSQNREPSLPQVGYIEFDSGDEGYYAVIEDSDSNVVQSLELAPGNYTVQYSKPGYKTARVSFSVSWGARISLPRPILVLDPTLVPQVRLDWNLVNVRRLLLLTDSKGVPVRDINLLEAGDYYLIFPDENLPKTLIVLTKKQIALVNLPSWVYQPKASTATAGGGIGSGSTSSGMCWVNGYYRKNGAYVSGYWRRC